jgi:ferric-dicitrate binding protein FerR (iron transport regulator)
VSDRYLWDKSGPPDEELERLERVLGRLGHRGAPLELPPGSPSTAFAARPRPAFRVAAWAMAAAVLAVLAGALWLVLPRGWQVQRVAGIPRIGPAALSGQGRIRAGEWLVTDAISRARLQVGSIGMVELGPRSRLRVLGTRGPEHRLALAQGSLLAAIVAPPRRFVVETPSAVAVDLGCAYTLEVDGTGNATLTVIAGWVSFEDRGRETFVPAGARCATRAGKGPGTPCFTDAAPALKNALAELDLAAPEVAPPRALDAALSAARREDAFTLWHLLRRVAPDDRARVADRLAELAPMPAGVTRPGILAGDPAMLDRWWDSLGLGGTDAWRNWQGPWPGAGTGRR